MQGKKQYQEKLFTSFQLSEHVPEENFYRRLKEILPLQWLYKATRKYYGTEEQQSVDPVVFADETKEKISKMKIKLRACQFFISPLGLSSPNLRKIYN